MTESPEVGRETVAPSTVMLLPGLRVWSAITNADPVGVGVYGVPPSVQTGWFAGKVAIGAAPLPPAPPFAPWGPCTMTEFPEVGSETTAPSTVILLPGLRVWSAITNAEPAVGTGV